MAKNTKQAQIKEIIKCGKDPTYFFNKYVKIQHPTRGSIPFKTYPFQDALVPFGQEMGKGGGKAAPRWRVLTVAELHFVNTVCLRWSTLRGSRSFGSVPLENWIRMYSNRTTFKWGRSRLKIRLESRVFERERSPE